MDSDEKLRTITLRFVNDYEAAMLDKLAERLHTDASGAVEIVCADAVREAMLLSSRTASAENKETFRRAI